MKEHSSGVCLVDQDFNIITVNKSAVEIYPGLRGAEGKKCYRVISGCEAPCEVCPITNHSRGPRIYRDSVRDIMVTSEAIEMPLPDGRIGYALVIGGIHGAEEPDLMKDTNERDLRQIAVINSLAKQYSHVYAWSLHDDNVDVYRYRGKIAGVEEQLSKAHNYQSLMKAYIDINVVEADREEMRRVTERDYLIRQLKIHETFIYHYRVLRNNEVHYYYMRCTRLGSSESFDTVVLGFANEDADVRYEKEFSFSSSGAFSAKRTILIVEDNPLNRDILRHAFSDEYSIIEAENGEDGLRILAEEFKSISLIILDIHMPVCDGFEFLKRVKKDVMLASVPILVASDSNDSKNEIVCLELGAQDFVSKPYNLPVMKQRIASTIRLSESTAALSAVEFDELTGLLTRQAFFHYAQQTLEMHPDKRYDLIVSDISDFKRINERYGVEVGDALLKHIGAFLKQGNSEKTLVARLGGDQFVSLMLHEEGREFNGEMASNFCNMIYDSAPIKDYTVQLGIYDDVDHSAPIVVLCDRAIMALRSIKHQYGKLFCKYDQRMQRIAEQEQRIEHCMEEALAKDQFKVYYQPKHNYSGALVGAEALVRWIHPTYGFMSPGEFIPLFEKNGFITRLDAYVWKQVCRDLRRWIDMGLRVVPISVNVSRKDFSSENFVDQLEADVQGMALNPSLLHIEVTESLYTEDANMMIPVIKKIREKGFKIEMDDFGAGYSSLAILSKIPLDVIKLDISFIRALVDQDRIVETMIRLAHSLGLITIAEGVETQEQLEMLRKMGCDRIQGYYFSKPLPREGFESYLTDYML